MYAATHCVCASALRHLVAMNALAKPSTDSMIPLTLAFE